MITIEVDKKTCKGDGRCVEICPVRILRMNDTQHVPEFIPGGEDLCINCGHCFASCPHGSIRLSTMSIDQAGLLDHAALPKSEQVELLLKGRRSIRLYKDEPVSRGSVEKLLDIARYAPSGINRQPVNWVAVLGKDKVHELAGSVVHWMDGLLKAKSPVVESLRFDRLVESWNKGKDLICRDAPCVIIAYGLKDDPIAAQSYGDQYVRRSAQICRDLFPGASRGRDDDRIREVSIQPDTAKESRPDQVEMKPSYAKS